MLTPPHLEALPERCPPQRPLLIGATHCPYVQRCRILLTELDVQHRFVAVDLAALPDWALALNPAARVPIWLDDDGVLLESSVINEFLWESAGRTPAIRQRARVRMAIASIDRALGAQHLWAERANTASGPNAAEDEDEIEIAWARAETALERLAAQITERDADAWLDAPLAVLLWRHHHLLHAARIAAIEPVGEDLPAPLAAAWERLRDWPPARALVGPDFSAIWADHFDEPAYPLAAALRTLQRAG